MKKILVAATATLALLSLAACAGKSPKAPPPIVTKG
jgi:predicted small lipoprotein YifL